MADTKLSNLSAGAAVSATDLFYNVQTAGAGGVKTLASDIATFILASPIVTGHATIEGVTLTGATGTGKIVFSIAPTITGHPTIEGVTSTGATGTGKFVFDTAPTISGHPTIEGVTSTGATGTGNFVFSISPTLSGTPVLGAATATSINKVTLTAPATGSTLTILDGKILTVNNTLTLAGTDSTTFTFPGVSDTVACLATANVFTAAQTISGAPLVMSGNISVASWGGAAISNIVGIRHKNVAATFTDTSTAASGTVANSATNIFGGNTISTTNASTVYTNYYGSYFKAEIAGAPPSITNNWALGADSFLVGTSNSFKISTAGAVTFSGSITQSGGATVDFTGPLQLEQYCWLHSDSSSNGIFFGSAADIALARLGAAALRLGKNASATPIAQIFTIGESSRSGTDSNVGGANGTIQPGLGTGTGTASAVLVQTPTLAASGTGAQTYTTRLTIDATSSRFAGIVQTGGLARVSTQFDKTSDTTLANIPGLSVTVVAGQSYGFSATLYTTSNAAGGVQAAVAGTATATAIIYEGEATAGAGISAQTRATALGTSVAGVTTVTAARIDIEGTITVNAGGTLTVQFAQNASNGTASSVLVGSVFEVWQIA